MYRRADCDDDDDDVGVGVGGVVGVGGYVQDGVDEEEVDGSSPTCVYGWGRSCTSLAEIKLILLRRWINVSVLSRSLRTECKWLHDHRDCSFKLTETWGARAVRSRACIAKSARCEDTA